jgi:hypothetical protein
MAFIIWTLWMDLTSCHNDVDPILRSKPWHMLTIYSLSNTTVVCFLLTFKDPATLVCLVLNLERNATDKSHGANFWGFIAIPLRAEPCPNDGNDQWHSDLQFSTSSQAYTAKFGCLELSGHIHLGVWSSTLNPVISLKQKKALFEDSSYLPLAIDEKRKL